MKFVNIFPLIAIATGIAIIVLFILAMISSETKETTSKKVQVSYATPKISRTIKEVPAIQEVSGTIYNPVTEQCDGSPLYTADGSYIDTTLLKRGKIKWLAVSQDLLQINGGPYQFGDTIFIHHPDDNVRGKWIIHDCMNPRVKRYLDFLQPEGTKFPPVTKHLLISNKKFYD